MTKLNVYIPALTVDGHRKTNSTSRINSGSAIVGREIHRGGEAWCLIYYEGGIYGQFDDYMEMMLHAAGRMVQTYPTVARMEVPPSALQLIGEYDVEAKTLEYVDIQGRAELAKWLKGTVFETTYPGADAHAMSRIINHLIDATHTTQESVFDKLSEMERLELKSVQACLDLAQNAADKLWQQLCEKGVKPLATTQGS